MIAFLLFAQLAVVAPKASFAATCVPASNQYTVDASASQRGSGGPIVAYRWNWANGRTETQPVPVVKNTWSAPGKFVVKLSVVDSSGRVSSVTQKTLTIPCPSVGTPPPILTPKPDTVWMPAPPPVHDTTVIRLPPIHDTLFVPSPPRTDTLMVVVHDSVTRVVHDTITVSTALPILPVGIRIDEPNGDRRVYWNNQLLGKLSLRTDGKVEAVRYSPAATFGQMGMKVQGVFDTQVEAIAALLLPAPNGWTP